MDSLHGNEIEGLEDSALDGKISRTKRLLESGHIGVLSDNGQKLKRFLQRLLAERERRNQLPRQKAENDKAATAQRSNLIGMEPRGREAVVVRDDPSFAVCPQAEERAEQRRGRHDNKAGPAQQRHRMDQEDEVVELREQIADIRSRLDMALRGISEAGVADLDDEDLQVFIGVSPEWRSVLRRVAVAAAAARAQRPSA